MEKERRNNVVRTLFIFFCFFQLLFDGFMIYTYFNQSKRLDIQDKLISDFVNEGNLLQKRFFVLNSYHNRLVESYFVGNTEMETTIRNWIEMMSYMTDEEFNNCVAQFKDPILMEELALKLDTPKITGYIIHLYDKFTFKEIGYTIFDENFVEYNIYGCGKAFYNETSKTLNFELV